MFNCTARSQCSTLINKRSTSPSQHDILLKYSRLRHTFRKEILFRSSQCQVYLYFSLRFTDDEYGSGNFNPMLTYGCGEMSEPVMCMLIQTIIQLNYIYISPNHNKSHLQILFIQTMSRPYSRHGYVSCNFEYTLSSTVSTGLSGPPIATVNSMLLGYHGQTRTVEFPQEAKLLNLCFSVLAMLKCSMVHPHFQMNEWRAEGAARRKIKCSFKNKYLSKCQ